MGTVIRFPDEVRFKPQSAQAAEGGREASIVILPVIRIERHAEQPSGEHAPDTQQPGGGRRRRSTRS